MWPVLSQSSAPSRMTITGKEDFPEVDQFQ